MDEEMIILLQKKVHDLEEQRDEARRDAEEWHRRADAIHGEYMQLHDQLRRGDFVRAKKEDE